MGVLTNIAILTLTLFSGVATRNLPTQCFVQLSSNPKTGPIPYCVNGEWSSCEQVTVDMKALRSNQPLILPNGEKVSFVDSSPGSESGSITAVYQSENLLNSMTITFYASDSNEVNAIIHEDGRVFNLAPCDQARGNCHVLAEEDPDSFSEGNTTSSYTMRDLKMMTKTALDELTEVEDRYEQGQFQQDTDGTYVATIKIYYTKEFAEVEPNVDAFISNMISQANACFRNSQTQIRLRLLCTEQLNNITENRDPATILNQFANIKGNRDLLRGTADFAHLLVKETELGHCGMAYIENKYYPFGISKRSCAIATYTFSHEIGHNFGCQHSRGSDADKGDYAFGYWIPGTGHRTAMAFWDVNHETRVNLYSNPDVRFRNVRVGNAQHNCAHKIRQNAKIFSSIGSDTNSCGSTIDPTDTVISTCSDMVYQFLNTGSRVVVKYPRSGKYRCLDECLWEFKTHVGRQLSVKIESMDIELDPKCQYDVLAVLGTTEGNLDLCGTGPLDDYTSEGNDIRLKFTSDGSLVKEGFRVVVEAL